jgi:predicted PurR-regulated permease PerM
MNSSFYKPFTFDRVVRLIISVVIALLIIFALHYLRQVLLPFFIAWLLAYFLYPMVKFVQFKLHFKNKSLSVITVLFFIIAFIIALFWFLTPAIFFEIIKLKDLILSYAQNESRGLFPQGWESFLQYFIHATNLKELSDPKGIIQIGQEFFPHAWKILSGSFSVIVSIFLVFIVLLYLFFILKDYSKIEKGFISMIPKKRRMFVARLMRDIESGMSHYYRGQASIALIVGVLFCIGFSIINMPLALLMGLLLGVLNLVPYLQIVGIPPTIILVLLRVAENGESPWWPLVSLLLVYVFVQVIQDGYLVPKIMGKRMGLNPAVILLSLSIWGMLLGVLGMIIALPVTTLLVSYYKRYILSEPQEQLLQEKEEINSVD